MDSSLLGSVCPDPGQRKVIAGSCPVCKASMVRKVGGAAACSPECIEKLKFRFKTSGKQIDFRKSRPKGLSKKQRRKNRQQQKKKIKASHSKKTWKNFRRESKKLKGIYGDSFYTTPEWRALRYAKLKMSGGGCEACGRSRKKHGVVIHIDHIKPRSKYPELALSLDNLQLLCEDCNLGKSNKDETDWRA